MTITTLEMLIKATMYRETNEGIKGFELLNIKKTSDTEYHILLGGQVASNTLLAIVNTSSHTVSYSRGVTSYDGKYVRVDPLNYDLLEADFGAIVRELTFNKLVEDLELLTSESDEYIMPESKELLAEIDTYVNDIYGKMAQKTRMSYKVKMGSESKLRVSEKRLGKYEVVFKYDRDTVSVEAKFVKVVEEQDEYDDGYYDGYGEYGYDEDEPEKTETDLDTSLANIEARLKHATNELKAEKRVVTIMNDMLTDMELYNLVTQYYFYK